MTTRYDIIIEANDKATRTLGKVNKQLNGLGKSASGAKKALAGVAAAVAAIGVGKVVKGIVDQYRAYEKYNTVLNTYLGSQAKATAELKRLDTLAKKLPQELGDITEAFVLFTSRGLDTSTKGLTAFSNIATANGKSLTQLGEAVADALTGEFERLKEFGIKVSKENGKFVADIGNGQSIIANSSSELVNKLKQLGEEGGKFGRAAGINATTLDQAFSNLNGALFSTAVVIGAELKPALRDAINLTTEWLDKNNELIKSLSTEVGKGLTTSFKAIGTALGFLAKNFEAIKNAALFLIFTRLASSVATLVGKMAQFTAGAKGFAGFFSGIGKVLSGVAASMGRFLLVITGIGPAMRLLAPLLLNPFTAIPAAITAAVVGGLWYFRDETFKLGETTAALGEIVAAVWFAVKKYVRSVIVGINGYFSDMYDNVRTGIGKVAGRFAEKMGEIMLNIKKGINIGIGLFAGMFQFIYNNIFNLPAMFMQALESSLSIIGKFVSRASGQIGELWDYITSFGADKVDNMFSGLGVDLQSELDKITSTIQPVNWGEILAVDYLGESAKLVEETAQELKNVLAPMFISMGGSIQSAMEDAGLGLEDIVEAYRKAQQEALTLADNEAALLRQEEARMNQYTRSAPVKENAITQTKNMTAALMTQSEFMQKFDEETRQSTNLTKLQAKAQQILALRFLQSRISLEEFQEQSKRLGFETPTSVGTPSNTDNMIERLQSMRAEKAELPGLIALLREKHSVTAEELKTLGLLNNSPMENAVARLQMMREEKDLQPELLKHLREKYNLTIKEAEAMGLLNKAKLTASEQIASALGDQKTKLDDINATLANTTAIEAMAAQYGVSSKAIIAALLEARKGLIDFKDEATTVSGIITDTWDTMSKNMAAGIAKGIMKGEGLFNSFSGFLKNFANTVITQIIQKMLVQPMINQMTQFGSSLMGGLGGGGGGGGGFDLLGSIGKFFAGGFATGGNIPGGQFGLVGENGPEFINGPARITPMDNDINSNEGLTVNFNINAISTSDGTSFILEHKKEITGVIQNAFNKRGKQGIY